MEQVLEYFLEQGNLLHFGVSLHELGKRFYLLFLTNCLVQVIYNG